ncbi:hypothetical protein MRB53_003820 [Persea americana]|uniref:Uncharacterized protein n=1 Tax=Persea americana TaxID=3435 RepID=A0ACC2MYE3_PERAE|nr:hypothetical protein MRB53_003820 [Persea americana]
MENQLRIRKRIHAIQRAPDGSAFEKCDYCGVSVAIALSDMHECDGKSRHKRFKDKNKSCCFESSKFRDQPRSPFRIFMESFWKTRKSEDWLEVDKRGFEEWKNKSAEERQPFVAQAEEIDSAYNRALMQELQDASKDSKEDEEADSAEVGKFALGYEYDTDSEQHSDSLESSSSFGTWLDEMYRIREFD